MATKKKAPPGIRKNGLTARKHADAARLAEEQPKRRGRGAPPKNRKLWCGRVHERIAACGLVMKSCEMAGLDYQTYAAWAREDPWIKQDEARAHERYLEILEAEADRRGVHGVPKPVIYKGQVMPVLDPESGEVQRDEKGQAVPLVVREYSDRMLEVRLRALAPERYRDNAKIATDDQGRVLVVPAQAGSVDDWMAAQAERKANAA